VRITEANLWDAPLPAVERLATSLGIVVNERARAAWGNEWRGWLIHRVALALRDDALRAKEERRRGSGYTVTDRRAR
jgi:hypothetical protein